MTIGRNVGQGCHAARNMEKVMAPDSKHGKSLNHYEGGTKKMKISKQ